jgi:predicted SAM-dependent methyltransferase
VKNYLCQLRKGNKIFLVSTAQKRIYVGCGEDRREVFLHCDIRPLPGVDIVCNAWELSQHTQGVDEIYSRHMLEHLTNNEVLATLSDWFHSLKWAEKFI